MSHKGKWRGACVSRIRDIYRSWLHRFVRPIQFYRLPIFRPEDYHVPSCANGNTFTLPMIPIKAAVSLIWLCVIDEHAIISRKLIVVGGAGMETRAREPVRPTVDKREDTTAVMILPCCGRCFSEYPLNVFRFSLIAQLNPRAALKEPWESRKLDLARIGGNRAGEVIDKTRRPPLVHYLGELGRVRLRRWLDAASKDEASNERYGEYQFHVPILFFA